VRRTAQSSKHTLVCGSGQAESGSLSPALHRTALMSTVPAPASFCCPRACAAGILIIIAELQFVHLLVRGETKHAWARWLSCGLLTGPDRQWRAVRVQTVSGARVVSLSSSLCRPLCRCRSSPHSFFSLSQDWFSFLCTLMGLGGETTPAAAAVGSARLWRRGGSACRHRALSSRGRVFAFVCRCTRSGFYV
jgi:hypothetical protein